MDMVLPHHLPSKGTMEALTVTTTAISYRMLHARPVLSASVDDQIKAHTNRASHGPEAELSKLRFKEDEQPQLYK